MYVCMYRVDWRQCCSYCSGCGRISPLALTSSTDTIFPLLLKHHLIFSRPTSGSVFYLYNYCEVAQICMKVVLSVCDLCCLGEGSYSLFFLIIFWLVSYIYVCTNWFHSASSQFSSVTIERASIMYYRSNQDYQRSTYTYSETCL